MKLNVNQVLTQYNGQPMMDVDNGKTIEATVKLALVNAVASPVQSDKMIDKIRKDELAIRIYKADPEVELTAEDVVLIKERVGEMYAPVIVGQIVRMLNQ
jgi:hypothetical protein